MITQDLENNFKAAAMRFEYTMKTLTAAYFIKKCDKEPDLASSIDAFQSETSINAFIDFLTDQLFENYSKIAVQAAKDLAEYVERYDIEASRIDFYKCAYFYSIEALCSYKKDFASKLCLGVTMIFLMEDALEHDIHKGLDDKMLIKLVNMVSEISELEYPWVKKLGIYGIYLIYKNVLKSLRLGSPQ